MIIYLFFLISFFSESTNKFFFANVSSFSEAHSKYPFKAFYTFDFSIKINTVNKEVV